MTATVPGALAAARQVRGVDARDLNTDPHLRRGALSVRWEGHWHVPRTGRYRLVAETDGALGVEVDGAAALSAAGGRVRAEADLAQGTHALRVTYASGTTPRLLRLQWSGPGRERQDFAGRWVFVAPPSPSDVARHRRAWWAWSAAALAWLVPPALALGLAARRGRIGPRARACLRVALPAAVVLVGGALRFEALVARYLWQGPRWAVDAERALASLHPPSLRWTASYEEDFAGDPLTYLRRARAMDGFFEANVREPVFPFATRLLLPLAGDGTWAVNAASAAFSTLLVLATYALGAAAFSRVVGLAAALLLALDRDAMWWGVEGFRDDAFATFTVLATAALVRMYRRPAPLPAVLAGLAGGAAVLTRLSGFSFLLPAVAFSALGRGEAGRARRRSAAIALVVALAVAAPYLVACAAAYGDAFHAVNFHTKFYRARSGMEHEAPMSWSVYLGRGFGTLGLLQKGLVGLTSYPFLNKWSGLDWVSPWLRRLLAPAAVAGLALFVFSPAGRLLLVVLLSSLLPYAFTWGVPGGAEWRFTLVAYPFYLVAAALALRWGLERLAARVRPDLKGPAEGQPGGAASGPAAARARPG